MLECLEETFRNENLSPKFSLITKAPTIKEFCVKKFIRKNTVESFLRILYSFHSKFEPIYIEHNLISHVIVP